jgi:hypothetical protein
MSASSSSSSPTHSLSYQIRLTLILFIFGILMLSTLALSYISSFTLAYTYSTVLFTSFLSDPGVSSSDHVPVLTLAAYTQLISLGNPSHGLPSCHFSFPEFLPSFHPMDIFSPYLLASCMCLGFLFVLPLRLDIFRVVWLVSRSCSIYNLYIIS